MMEYKGRRITARLKTNKATGEKTVEIRCNGKFAWVDYNSTIEKSLEMAKGYIDDADERPRAYPVLKPRRGYKAA